MSSSQTIDVPRLEAPDIASPHARPLRKSSVSLDRATPFLIFAISLWYLCLFRRYSNLDLDEGIILQAAERVLHGQIPYRDFFLFYTPGSVYIQAALFRFVGDSFAVARTGIAIIGAVCSTGSYCLARRVCNRSFSLLAAALTTLVGVTYRFAVLHNWYSTLIAVLTVYAAVRLLESKNVRWGFIVGSLASLTILTEQSKGPGLCGGLLLGWVLLRFANIKFPRRSAVLSIAAGFLWPWIATLLYFASRHAIVPMIQDWLWPLHHYTQANHVFYGHLSWSEDARASMDTGPLWVRFWEYFALSPLVIIPVLPLLGLAWLAFWVTQLWKTKGLVREAQYHVLLSAVAVGLLLSILIVRTDITDFVYMSPLWYVVLVWTLQKRNTRFGTLQILRPYALGLVCAGFGIMGFALLLGVNGATAHSMTRRGLVVTATKDGVIHEIQTRIPADGELLVYPYLPLYNYLTQTLSPASLEYFQAGMNTKEQALSITSSLATHKTRWILFDAEFPERIWYVWPHTPQAAVANDLVGKYIVHHYHLCKMLPAGNGVTLWLLRVNGESCAQVPDRDFAQKLRY